MQKIAEMLFNVFEEKVKDDGEKGEIYSERYAKLAKALKNKKLIKYLRDLDWAVLDYVIEREIAAIRFVLELVQPEEG